MISKYVYVYGSTRTEYGSTKVRKGSFVLSKVLSYFRTLRIEYFRTLLGNTFVLSYLSTKVLLY